MPSFPSVAIIGGGAAGFFAAINIARLLPHAEIVILEKTTKLLSKVRISGGGRCNVTNAEKDTDRFLSNYPRGSRELRQVFARHAAPDTIRWFHDQGVELKTEADGRMFPVTDSSETIISCFTRLASKYGITIKTQCEVFSIEKQDNHFLLRTSAGELKPQFVVCASGGHAKKGSYDLIARLGHRIIDPIPSLFTLNIPGERRLLDLQGLSVPEAEVRLAKARTFTRGPVLITHWGLSGPAVLKLSAFAAEEFFRCNYDAQVEVNWSGLNRAAITEELEKAKQAHRRALPRNTPLPGIPSRLWEHLCTVAGIESATPWAEIPKTKLQALGQALTQSLYHVQGKTTFKEEFVTSGGVDLREIDFRKMQSKLVPGLFFCGEVLNIDAVTGGFNFQAAWSTAYVCASAVAETKF